MASFKTASNLVRTILQRFPEGATTRQIFVAGLQEMPPASFTAGSDGTSSSSTVSQAATRYMQPQDPRRRLDGPRERKEPEFELKAMGKKMKWVEVNPRMDGPPASPFPDHPFKGMTHLKKHILKTLESDHVVMKEHHFLNLLPSEAVALGVSHHSRTGAKKKKAGNKAEKKMEDEKERTSDDLGEMGATKEAELASEKDGKAAAQEGEGHGKRQQHEVWIWRLLSDEEREKRVKAEGKANSLRSLEFALENSFREPKKKRGGTRLSIFE